MLVLSKLARSSTRIIQRNHVGEGSGVRRGRLSMAPGIVPRKHNRRQNEGRVADRHSGPFGFRVPGADHMLSEVEALAGSRERVGSGESVMCGWSDNRDRPTSCIADFQTASANTLTSTAEMNTIGR